MRLPSVLTIACVAGGIAALAALINGYGAGGGIAVFVMVAQAAVFILGALIILVFWDD